LKQWLKSDRGDLRLAAAYAIGEKKTPLPKELIELLSDPNPNVQQSARRSLILLGCHATCVKNKEPSPATQVNRLLKLGPVPTTNQGVIAKAVQKWSDWWAQNDPELKRLKGTPASPGEKEEQAKAAAAPPRLETAPAKPVSDKPEDPAAKAERLAAAKLNLAKQLASDGLLAKARTRFQEIIDTYPKTKAAAEARKLLEKLGK